MPTDEEISCQACGEECDGASECNNCGNTLCPGCATEYDECCSICYDDYHSHVEFEKGETAP